MSAKILIPTPLRAYSGEQASVDVEATNVAEALAELTRRYPELRRHLYHESTGKLRSFVNIFVGDEDIRHGKGVETAIPPDTVISIVPSIAGGKLTTDPAPRVGDTKAPLPELSKEEIARYSRHLILPEVGMEGQRKLKQASVALVGTGGLGAPVALYLAAAGVGRLGLIDFDVVDHSNLQRQVIHGTKDIGRPKLDSARDSIADINPNVRVDGYEVALTSENALEILKDYDIVIDGTDNFPTRYLVNDACVLLHKPNVYGSIFRFEGQASVFWADHGPCYRCLFPEPPPPGLVPSCAEGGVLGVLPGVIGVIQATEAIKLILGTGESLLGRLLLYDALAMRYRELKLRKDPDCCLCSDHPTLHGLIDYHQFCGVPKPGSENDVIEPTGDQLEPAQLKAILDKNPGITLVDVRNPNEWDICRIQGAQLLPLPELPTRFGELDRNADIVVYCKLGARSERARLFLRDAGFTRVRNLRGGILAWQNEVDPSLARY